MALAFTQSFSTQQLDTQPLSTMEDCTSSANFAFLESAAEYCDKCDKEANDLQQHVEETYQKLKKIWPKGDGKPPLPCLNATILANYYYVMALPISRSGEQKHTRLLLLAELHAATPSSLIGKPWLIGSTETTVIKFHVTFSGKFGLFVRFSFL
jgi:hypothetical protein